jgi:hypothetical protein
VIHRTLSRKVRSLTTLVVCLATIGAGGALAGSAAASPVPVTTFTPQLTYLGTINMSSLGSSSSASQAAPSAGGFRAVDNQILAHRPGSSSSASRLGRAAPDTSVTTSNVPGEYGFTGITGYQQAQANSATPFPDLEPPDQGLCAGYGDVGEFVNNAFTVYQPYGQHLLPVIPSYELFKQPSTAFLSDPRCHYDAATQRWFLTEFVVGSSSAPSEQFIDVSTTSDPTGTYMVWEIDTTDASTAGCPCFGDYDELGLDQNGVYITTDEFPDSGAGYNGVIIYAISKELLETYLQSGIAPVPVAYRLTADQFGQPYIVSPTSTPPRAAWAPNTEYFVESNGNAFADDHLAVYALHNTSLLAQPGVPSLYEAYISSEPYAFPPDAQQKPGPIPLGHSVGDPLGPIQTDFDAVMQTTYVGGNVYAELDTATLAGNTAAAWFVIKPTWTGGTLAATIPAQGYVDSAGTYLMYPAIGVNSAGNGYMAFSLTNPTSYYPSSAYIDFGPAGASGPIHVAQSGSAPEDGFTCYAAFVGPNYGGCRWGDYSAAVAMGSNIYMASEMITPVDRDYLTNWDTFVYRAPAP